MVAYGAVSDLVQTIAEAIARFEGFFQPGSLAQRNNNPGNLRSGPRAVGKDSRGYAVYRTPADGWADLYRQVELNISRGLTLREFFGGKPGVYAGYAPAADRNQPDRYAAYVASQAGVPTDVPLISLRSVTAPVAPVQMGDSELIVGAVLAGLAVVAAVA